MHYSLFFSILPVFSENFPKIFRKNFVKHLVVTEKGATFALAFEGKYF